MMPSLLSRCDPDRLALLANDDLSPAEVIELEQHLETCANCRTTLDRLVTDDRYLEGVQHYLRGDPTDVFDAPPSAAESLEFLAPSDWPDSLGTLGTYEIKGVLGRGGMGVVLKAFDPALSRNVAIKVLAPSLASCGAARQRFLREARAAAAVVHEHVVAVYSVVETSGLPFLVMEYVPGRSLQERLDAQGPVSLPEALRIGMQTAAGLAAAHAQGLVHRDVKPANILLEDGVERVRLSDFGLARAAADAALTTSGIVAGTPHYMAPEQARGETVDARADLFSLGATLYAICAGHPPFRAETPLAVLRRVCDDAPRSLREQNPEVPAWLEAVVARLLAKDPSRRFQTAAEVAELLGRCLAHVQQPLTSPLPEGLGQNLTARRPSRMTRRSGAIVAVVAGVTLTAATVFVRSPGLLKNRDAEPKALASAAPDPVLRGVRPVAVAATDELQRLLDDTENQARSFYHEIYSQTTCLSSDQLAERSGVLSREINALEHDILSVPVSPQSR
jgi:serine/threonine protein kinase